MTTSSFCESYERNSAVVGNDGDDCDDDFVPIVVSKLH
jgi:hypothetical protein